MIFIDTWAWRARAIGKADSWHAAADPAWRKLLQAQTPLLTTWMVVDEVVNAVARYSSGDDAARVYRAILATRRLTFQEHNAKLYAAALAMMEQRPDKNFGITDAVSFVAMKRHGCGRAFTGDRHFTQAGFEVIPD